MRYNFLLWLTKMMKLRPTKHEPHEERKDLYLSRAAGKSDVLEAKTHDHDDVWNDS